MREMHVAVDHLAQSTQRLVHLRKGSELEWNDTIAYHSGQIGRWFTWEENDVLVELESSFSLVACALLKSWVHVLEMTLSMIKGLLKGTVRETGANKPEEEFEKQV
jgi:hypothetical protein